MNEQHEHKEWMKAVASICNADYRLGQCDMKHKILGVLNNYLRENTTDRQGRWELVNKLWQDIFDECKVVDIEDRKSSYSDLLPRI